MEATLTFGTVGTDHHPLDRLPHWVEERLSAAGLAPSRKHRHLLLSSAAEDPASLRIDTAAANFDEAVERCAAMLSAPGTAKAHAHRTDLG